MTLAPQNFKSNAFKKDRMQPVLPDLLEPGLKLVFCGTAAGRLSAERGQYYAHPQNKFWRILHATGLTPRLFAPAEFPELSRLGIGLTDIAKHTSGMDSQLPQGSLGKDAIAALRYRIEKARPHILAFTSLTGGCKFLGGKPAFGAQAATIGSTRLWVLPSPSPAAHWNWEAHKHIWHELAADIHRQGA
jgi:double-stranded uracil-DNA glycosylase